MNLRPVSFRMIRLRLPGEHGTPAEMSGLTGMVAVFGACFTGLVAASWADWGELGYAVFFMASSLTAYYVRPGHLLPVVVSAPLLFLLACLTASVVTPSLALLSTLAGVAWWMLAGMALTVLIALLRGLRAEVRELWVELRQLPGAQFPRELEAHLLLDGLDLFHVREAQRG